MARYAEGTEVAVEKSQAELKRLIERYGARKVLTFDDQDEGVSALQFQIRDRQVLLRLRFPAESEFRLDARGRLRTDNARYNAWDAERRRLWRSLVMVVKAKLESVESGIETFDEAFLPHLVMEGGGTIGDRVLAELPRALASGFLPALAAGRPQA